MKPLLMFALAGLTAALAAPGQEAAALEPQTGLTYVEPTPPYRDYLPQLKTTTVFQDIADEDLIALISAMGPKVLRLKDGEQPQTWDASRFLILLKTVPTDGRPVPGQVPRRFKWDMPKDDEPGRLIWAVPALSGYHQALGLKFEPPANQRRADIEALEVTGEMLTGDYGARLAPAQGRMIRNLLGMLAQQITDIRQMYNLAGSGRDMYAPRPAAPEEDKGPGRPSGPAGLKSLYVTYGPEAAIREFLPELKTTTIFQDIPDEALIKMLETMKPGIALMKRDSPMAPLDPDYYYIILRSVPAGEQKARRFKYDMPKFGEPGMMMAEIPGLAQYMVTLGHTGGGPRPGPAREHDMYLMDVHQNLFTNYFNEEILPAQRKMWRNYLGILAQKVLDVRQGLLYRYEGLDIYERPQPGGPTP